MEEKEAKLAALPAAGWVAISVLIKEFFAWLKSRKKPKKEEEK